MKRILLIALFAIATLMAQEKDDNCDHTFQNNWKPDGGSFYFMIGGLQNDLDEFNKSLTNQNFSKMDNVFLTLGGGGHFYKGRLVFGGEGHGVIGKEVLSRGYNMKLRGGYGFFNIGYRLLQNDGFNLYPLLGIGGGTFQFTLVENSSPSFDDILSNPGRMSTLTNAGFMLQAAVVTEFYYPMYSDENGEGGLVFGIRAGYIITPLNSDWYLDEEKISGGPDLGINGPYINLAIGFGGHPAKK